MPAVPSIRRAHTAAPITEFAYMQAPMGGWDADSPPMFMPETFAVQLDNFEPRSSKLVMRSGMVCQEDVSSWSPGLGAYPYTALIAAFKLPPANAVGTVLLWPRVATSGYRTPAPSAARCMVTCGDSYVSCRA